MKSHRDMVTLRFLAGFGLEFGGWGGTGWQRPVNEDSAGGLQFGRSGRRDCIVLAQMVFLSALASLQRVGVG